MTDHHESDGFIVTTIDGRLTLLNTDKSGYPDVKCPACLGGEHQATCRECAGRGKVTNVPYCERPWDEIMPGLFLGGHQCQPANGEPGTLGDVVVRNEFDAVVTLCGSYPKFGPPDNVRHLRYHFEDDDLDPVHHDHIEKIAEEVHRVVTSGDKVLVRCWGGMNRSSLVVAMVLMKSGMTAREAMVKIRQTRSPYCLFNESFQDYLLRKDGAV